MPIYEYECEVCGAVFDKFVRSMANGQPVECPKCHSAQCHKKISSFASSSTTGANASAAACAPSG